MGCTASISTLNIQTPVRRNFPSTENIKHLFPIEPEVLILSEFSKPPKSENSNKNGSDSDISFSRKSNHPKIERERSTTPKLPALFKCSKRHPKGLSKAFKRLV